MAPSQDPCTHQAEETNPIQHHADVAAVPISEEANIECLQRPAPVAGSAAGEGRQRQNDAGDNAQGKRVGDA